MSERAGISIRLRIKSDLLRESLFLRHFDGSAQSKSTNGLTKDKKSMRDEKEAMREEMDAWNTFKDTNVEDVIPYVLLTHWYTTHHSHCDFMHIAVGLSSGHRWAGR